MGGIGDMKKFMEERNEKGFTLIELLVAIVVVGILAAVAIVGIGGLTDSAKKSTCSATLDASRAGVAAYYASQSPNAYPATFSDMTAPPAGQPTLVLHGGVQNPTGTTLTDNGSPVKWTITLGANGVLTSDLPSCVEYGGFPGAAPPPQESVQIVGAEMGMHRNDERGDTLVEILVAMVIIGIVMGAYFAAYTTATMGSRSQKDLSTADALLRSSAETMKSAVRDDCADGGTTYSPAPVATPAGFTLSSTAVPAGNNCPDVTALQLVNLKVTLPNGSTKSLVIDLRSP
jgi:type IV pilus assembly protein PilA